MFASINDCAIVNNADIKNTSGYSQMLKTVEEKDFTRVLPEEALQKALENLKKFCCQSNTLQEENCKGYKEKQGYPLSPFLYDHLIDVQLRRLDGIQELSYGIQGDPMGIQRRQFIENTLKAEVSPQAKEITEKYKTYWTSKNTINEQSTSEQISRFLREYNTTQTSLIDKYNTTCQIMANLYNSIANEKVLLGNSKNKNSAYSTCQNIVQRRIANEHTLVKAIIIKTSNETIHETYKTYTMKYFIQEKII